VPIVDVPQLWDRLLEALRAAASAEDPRALDRALLRGRSSASELYTTLDPSRSPEVSTHLHGVLDLCMTQLDRASRTRDSGSFDLPMRLLEAVRPSL
jgi:hypothetical protein